MKIGRILALAAVALGLGAATLSYAGGPETLDVIDRLTPGAGASRVASGEVFGAHGHRLDVWRDGDAKPGHGPVLVFFHGGGWVKGDRQSYGWAARGYASKGFVVVVPDYRKVPGVRFPAFVEDGAEAIRWTRDNIARFGGDPDRIAIAGHSAGAHTVAMLALDPQWLARAKLPRDTIKTAVGLSGPYDFLPFTGRSVAAMSAWPDPKATQPITFARADAPPMLLVTGTDDTTVRPKNARNLAARLKAVGADVELREYAGEGHEDIVMALSRPFRGKSSVLADSVAFLDARVGKAAPASPPRP